MKPAELIILYGEDLIGKWVETEAMASYPGGPAKVTHIFEDPEAPEIPILVEHPEYGAMGIFEYEELTLLSI